MKDETLTYMSKARAAIDGKDGYNYRHGWGTGYQDLVFASHYEAERWAVENGATYTGPKK